ncbi:response regulator [Microvirga sp. VF16]|uniref:response regulator n=1 Tax=Microvirga sp. VF16 TaxID=2807101 RepID=UPI00352FFB0E
MARSSAAGRPCALLVESNAAIGMYLADDLEDQGYAVAGPFTCAGAMKWLATDTPDIAVLDVDLQSGSCVGMARELKQRKVPIIVYSPHEQKHALPEFQQMPWVSIPSTIDALHNALADYGIVEVRQSQPKERQR